MHSFWLAQVSQPLLNKMLEQLHAGGSVITREADTYTVEGSGITAQINYEPTNQRALVTILSKPFLAPVSYIESEVRKALKEARG